LADTIIQDRPDRQGIILLGYAEDTDQIIDVLKENLPDIITREKLHSLDNFTGKMPIQLGFTSWDVEFTHNAKRTLDEIRHTVKPTILDHHLFKTISPEKVDEAERELERFSDKRNELSLQLQDSLIYKHLRMDQEVQFEHVKPNGTVITLVPGRIVELLSWTLKVKRTGFRGRSMYDGINVPKDQGDYAITEAKEGSWILKHAYYSSDDRMKGEMYNVNTPLEIYPGKIRYTDLEVDVVRKVGEAPRIIDLDKLEAAVEAGFITDKLADLAREKAKEVYRDI